MCCVIGGKITRDFAFSFSIDGNLITGEESAVFLAM
jgi:hypothetical protein